MRRGLAIIMSHSRDISVFHTKQKVIFEIPLYFEPRLQFEKIVFENNRLVIETSKLEGQTPPHHEEAESSLLSVRDDPKNQ